MSSSRPVRTVHLQWLARGQQGKNKRGQQHGQGRVPRDRAELQPGHFRGQRSQPAEAEQGEGFQADGQQNQAKDGHGVAEPQTAGHEDNRGKYDAQGGGVPAGRHTRTAVEQVAQEEDDGRPAGRRMGEDDVDTQNEKNIGDKRKAGENTGLQDNNAEAGQRQDTEGAIRNPFTVGPGGSHQW